jgi:hypothetical protein
LIITYVLFLDICFYFLISLCLNQASGFFCSNWCEFFIFFSFFNCPLIGWIVCLFVFFLSLLKFAFDFADLASYNCNVTANSGADKSWFANSPCAGVSYLKLSLWFKFHCYFAGYNSVTKHDEEFWKLFLLC